MTRVQRPHRGPRRPSGLAPRTMLVSSAMCVAVSVFATPGFAQRPESLRAFSLDTRYRTGAYANRAIGRFGVEMLNLSTVPADLIGTGGPWRNVARAMTLLVGSTFLEQGFGIPFHEFGHGTRVAAIGLRPIYGFGRIRTAADVTAAYASGDTHEGFFGYYRRYLFGGGSAYTLGRNQDPLFPPFTDMEAIAIGWDGNIAAGGLNNEMYFAELLEDELHQRGGHAGFLTSYINAKLSAKQYNVSGVFGDKANVVAYYRARGYAISSGNIDDASVRSFAFSSASYQILWETVRLFAGKPLVNPGWSFHGVELPNLSFYMTRSGLSHKLRSGFRWGDWRVPVAVERVFEGEARTEISLGGEHRSARLGYAGEATIGRQLGLELEVDYRIDARFLVSAGYVLYDERNLRGERHIPSLKRGVRYHGIHARAAIVY